MRITLITLDNWGFNNHIAVALKQQGHNVHHINFDEFEYKYPNVFYKVYNFILKSVFKKNIKTNFFGKKVIENLEEIGEIQDVILVIKWDLINTKNVLKLKKYGKKTIAYFNDNTKRCTKILHVLPHFDEVFSFEKEDCKKYNLKFAPNWIYNSSIKNNTEKFAYQVFSIITKDKRLPILSKIATNLKLNDINYKIFVYTKSCKRKTGNIQIERCFYSQFVFGNVGPIERTISKRKKRTNRI